jgi:glycosyltransferase involved in cell wall biosynthesis
MAGLADSYDWEVVLVDDGSIDETGAIADTFASAHTHVRVLHHKVNFNLGQALRYAFGTCTGDYVVVIDCDLSYSPDHITRMLGDGRRRNQWPT